jgi:hypothetical protein
VKNYLLFLGLFVGGAMFAQQAVPSNTSLDPRATRYYTPEQIAQMDALKVAQLNFIFQHSWVVNTLKPCPECPAIDMAAFDVYEYTREAKSRKRVYLTVPGNPIDLLSFQELDAELNRIKNEMNSNSSQH